MNGWRVMGERVMMLPEPTRSQYWRSGCREVIGRPCGEVYDAMDVERRVNGAVGSLASGGPPIVGEGG